MDVASTDLFNLLDRRLAWIDQRQQVLAQNIANADTPGYQRADIAPFTAALDNAANLLPRTTSASDLPALPASDQLSIQPEPPAGADSVDSELGKLADTEGMQALAVNLYGAWLGMFRTALGVSGGTG